MTEKEYRAYPAVSRSELWKISKSPEKYKYELDNPPEPTEALIFGQALHKFVLERETFRDEFAVAPDIDKRTKEGKAKYAEFISSCQDKIVILSDMMEKITAMSDKLEHDNYVKKLLIGDHEKPFFWTDDITGEACKCRVDCITKIGDTPIIVDIKTTANAETDTFMRSALKYGYHVQAAMYSEGVKANTGLKFGFVFIAIEKEPPYSINIMETDELFTLYGYNTFRDLLNVYHDCKKIGNWYGYLGKNNNVNVLGLPSYLEKEI